MEYIKYLPKNHISRATGQLAQLEQPKWLVDRAKSWFVDRYQLNMDEAEHPLSYYRSLGELFTRRLKEGARPMAEGLVHPCDAQLTQMGTIESGQLLQNKGTTYSLADFIKDPVVAEGFEGGSFLTYYLCPTDYHRVHCPIQSKLEQLVHIPGHLWPVNPWSVENISQLFAINERVVFHLETEFGKIVLVMIGATNVGQIEVPFDPEIRTNLNNSDRSPLRKTYCQAIDLEKGDELGVFHMGSSVVMLLPEGMMKQLPAPTAVKLGESLVKDLGS